MAKTQCIYCSSSTYGRPCLYSPTNTHVHMDEPGKCIYCGSPHVGGGCIYNPYGTQHVRGPEYLISAKVKTEKAIILNYLLNKIGAEVLSESYSSPLDRFYKRIVNIILTTAEPLLEALGLQQASIHSRLEKQQLITALEYKHKFKKHFNELNKTISEAGMQLPPEIVEEYLVDAIIDSKDGEQKN